MLSFSSNGQQQTQQRGLARTQLQSTMQSTMQQHPQQSSQQYGQSSGNRNIVTTQQYTNTINKRVAQQHHSSTLHAYSSDNQRLQAANESDDRVDTLRRLKRVEQHNAELLQLQQIEEQQERQQQRQLIAEQDERLIASVALMKQQDASQQARVAKICNSNEELQQLKLQLKAAEINQIRTNQIIETKLNVQQTKQQQQQIDTLMEQDRQLAVQLEAQYRQQQLVDSRISSEALKQQIQYKQAQQQQVYELFLAEKSVVDEIVRSIGLEDNKKQDKLNAQKVELQQTIADYLVEREQWRESEKQRLLSELKAIADYQAMQEQRQQALLSQQKAKFVAHDTVLEQLTADINARQQQEEQYRLLLQELYMEEAEQKAIADVRAREQKLLQQRKAMMLANEQQMLNKQALLLQQQAEELQFRQLMLERLHNDSRIEQMNRERKQREITLYKQEIERLIDDKRQKQQQQQQQQQQEVQQQQQQLQEELMIVERERAKLLDEYGQKLHDFMPKNVYRSEQEYERASGRQIDKQQQQQQQQMQPPSAQAASKQPLRRPYHF